MSMIYEPEYEETVEQDIVLVFIDGKWTDVAVGEVDLSLQAQEEVQDRGETRDPQSVAKGEGRKGGDRG